MIPLAGAFPTWEAILCAIALIAAFGGLIFAGDDLWIDLYALVHRLKPRELTNLDLDRMNSRTERRIAIMIANWHEDEVLARMITGNINQLKYGNYVFFLGVYPNDLETTRVAKELEAKFPQRVRVITNVKAGPTTKGQMLNEIVRGIFHHELVSKSKFDIFLMQDSEDVLHPYSLALINDSFANGEGADLIQFPVFSFLVPAKKLVGGTYVDEFAEIHTKDLLVRERMGAAIPSAGTGTALSRRLVLMNLSEQAGNLLRENTLTEDYDLGIGAKLRGLKTKFNCSFLRGPAGEKDFVATREFFPDRLKSAVRQKTRWTLGIAFQGSRNFGWRGEWVDRYFMMRDRRGPVNALLLTFGFITVISFSVYGVSDLEIPNLLTSEIFVVPAGLNFVAMVLRLWQRARAVARVYGRGGGAVPIRFPVSNLINTLAAYQAMVVHGKSVLTGIAPKWEKTKHVMPEGFGRNHGAPQIEAEGAG